MEFPIILLMIIIYSCNGCVYFNIIDSSLILELCICFIVRWESFWMNKLCLFQAQNIIVFMKFSLFWSEWFCDSMKFFLTTFSVLERHLLLYIHTYMLIVLFMELLCSSLRCVSRGCEMHSSVIRAAITQMDYNYNKITITVIVLMVILLM